jgi:hypothetical protein
MGGLMIFPFFRSKSSKLKKLLEEDHLSEAQKLIDEDDSLIDDLIHILNSSNPKLKSNSIFLATKVFLKYGRDINKLIPHIKKFLNDEDEDMILNALVSLKMIVEKNPEYFKLFEKEIWKINKKIVNLQIREYTWELIKKYGEVKEYKLDDRQKKMHEQIKRLMQSSEQESLLRKLFEIGSSMLDLEPEKLEVTEEKLRTSISKEQMKIDFGIIKNGGITHLDPLNMIYILSKVPELNKNELERIIDKVLDLLVSDNNIIRNMVLNTIYDISKNYPDIIYNHLDKLEEYAKKFGGRNNIFKSILKEISKEYDLRNTPLAKYVE